MTSASSATTAPSSTGSSGATPTSTWSRRCGASWRSSRRAHLQDALSRARACCITSLLLAALPLTSAGCEELAFEGWLGRSIPIHLRQNIPFIPILADGDGPIEAVLDTGSPLTVVDPCGGGRCKTCQGDADCDRGRCHDGLCYDGGTGIGARYPTELRLQQGTLPDKSRFIFPDFEVFDLALGKVGLDSPLELGGVIGSSLLSHFSVQLHYGPQPTLTLSDGLPDANTELAAECEHANLTDPAKADQERCAAALSAPRIGGGLLEIGDELLHLPASRLVVPICLSPAPFDPTQIRAHGAEKATGVPAMALVATGFGTSVITRSAFDRLRARDPSLTETEGYTLFLPSGIEQASLVQLPQVALVSNETQELGPCGELALRRRILVADLTDEDEQLLVDHTVNGASAAVSKSTVTFVVVEDDAALIQGIRKEVQPYVADVDIVLGGSFFKDFDLLVDYPSGRLILRCIQGAPAGACGVLPWCGWTSEDHPSCPGRPE